MMPVRTLVVLFASTAALGLAACGGDDGEALLKTVQDRTEQIQKKGEAAQAKAAAITAKIQSGELSPEEGQQQLQALSDQLTKEAGSLAKDALDEAERSGAVPDDVKDQLQDAREQLDQVSQPTP